MGVKTVKVSVVRHYATEPKVCEQCGAQFEGYRTARYCSPRCRNLAGWRRHSESYNERRRERRKEGNQA